MATATPLEKKIRAAKTRNTTAAKRALKLIAEETAAALAVLENGGVPDSSFTASVIKYEQARNALALLDLVTGGEPVPDGAEIPDGVRENIALLVKVVLACKLLPEGAVNGDGPLGQLARVAFPDGLQPSVMAAAQA